jgi:hypothetical protein
MVTALEKAPPQLLDPEILTSHQTPALQEVRVLREETAARAAVQKIRT